MNLKTPLKEIFRSPLDQIHIDDRIGPRSKIIGDQKVDNRTTNLHEDKIESSGCSLYQARGGYRKKMGTTT